MRYLLRGATFATVELDEHHDWRGEPAAEWRMPTEEFIFAECRCGEMADAQDLKSWDLKKSCRFESDHRHHYSPRILALGSQNSIAFS